MIIPRAPASPDAKTINRSVPTPRVTSHMMTPSCPTLGHPSHLLPLCLIVGFMAFSVCLASIIKAKALIGAFNSLADGVPHFGGGFPT
jgi:hypothetical protein